jgi:putative inorganic carbon (hco3(-)) transporter
MDAFRIKDYTAQERVAIWKGAVQMIREKPWIGVGAGNFSRAFFERKIDFHFDRSQEKVENYHSHNLFLQIAAESGIPAAVMLLAFFLWLMGKAVVLKIRGLDLDAGLISGLAAFFVYSLFDSTYNAYFTHASMFHVNLVVLMFISRLLWEVDSANRSDEFKGRAEKALANR